MCLEHDMTWQSYIWSKKSNKNKVIQFEKNCAYWLTICGLKFLYCHELHQNVISMVSEVEVAGVKEIVLITLLADSLMHTIPICHQLLLIHSSASKIFSTDK